MQTLRDAVLPILIALAFGYAAGRRLDPGINAYLVRLIGPLVWLLLFSVGRQFGDVLSHSADARHVALLALLFAALTTAIPWLLIMLMRRPGARAISSLPSREPRSRFKALLKPAKECAIALLMVTGGALTSLVTIPAAFVILPFPVTTPLLYALIGLVGLDMAGIAIGSAWLSVRMLVIPPLVVIGSLLGGVVAAKLSGEPLSIALALSSGFGWFTLSGVLVAKYLGNTYGAVALLTDLFRELLAVVLLYSLGARFSRACIGASAATALDSTLPVIKQTCGAGDVPAALVSGLVLTIVAPVLISFFLTW